MYLKDYLKQFEDRKVKLFVDMDGVIVDFILGSAKDYDQKRPLYDTIKKLEEISKMPNVELYIFSATRYSEGFAQKHWWLDQYAPFFKKENRIIISREDNDMEESSSLKAKFLRDYERDGSVLIVIDDDPKNLREIRKLNDDVILLKDTVLEDDTAIKYEDINDYLFIALGNAYSDLSWKTKLNDEEFFIGIQTPEGIIQKKLKMEHWDEVAVEESSTGIFMDVDEEQLKKCLKSLCH